MSKALKFHHRRKIEELFARRNFADLSALLAKLGAQGFDVAGTPFRLLDKAFSEDQALGLSGMASLANLTLGGQPDLIRAIVNDATSGNQNHLSDIARDRDAHPMTRFEAMGWSLFLRNRSLLPETGEPSGEIFQFWDEPNPPEEICIGLEAWELIPHSTLWYSEEAAAEYVKSHFGGTAAANFLKLWHPALKSDVFRLYRLVQDGGIYADADGFPGPGLASFAKLAGSKPWATSMTNVPNCVANNYFLAGPAKSPVFEGFLSHVLRNIAEKPVSGIFWLSGPGAFTHYLKDCDPEISLLPLGIQKNHLFSQFDAAYKKTKSNWRVYEHAKGLTNDSGLELVLGATSSKE